MLNLLTKYGTGGEKLISSQAKFWMEPLSGDLTRLALGDATGVVMSGSPTLSASPQVYHAGTVNGVLFDNTGTRIHWPNCYFSHMNMNQSFWLSGMFRLPEAPSNEGMFGNGANSDTQAGVRCLLAAGGLNISISDGTTRPLASMPAVSAFPLNE